MTAILILAGLCLSGWLAMTANSYRYYRLCLKIEKSAGIPHQYPTFFAWQDEVWRRAMKEFRSHFGGHL